jgi:hypothetical protein
MPVVFEEIQGEIAPPPAPPPPAEASAGGQGVAEQERRVLRLVARERWRTRRLAAG